MIEIRRGDLFEADVEALVNTVNCVGVMGKGIALQFKLRFPENFKQYKTVCDADELEPGEVFVFDRGDLFGDEETDSGRPRYIINVPTKTHWKNPSKLEYIEAGMEALVQEIEARNIASIAIPPLGCGNGGLDWDDVRPIIESHLDPLPEVRTVLFAPGYEPDVEDIKVNTEPPDMTRGRALVIKLLDLYKEADYRLGHLEVQKLAYLLQSAGEDMQLRYEPGKYGPYANNLNHVLQRMEGHFTEGYGDRQQDAEIHLLPGVVEEAEREIADDPDAKDRLERVRRLIEGFETPYGLELLTTVLWVVQNDPRSSRQIDHLVRTVQNWNRRKRELLEPEHIVAAWERIESEGWSDADPREEGSPVPA